MLDYSAKEREEIARLSKSSMDPFEMKAYYTQRYPKLREPIAWSAICESIWPQIPLFGTLLIPVAPYSEGDFSKYHGFDASDVDRLADFAKDTGRVAFVLNGDPEEYAGLDFLDPVLDLKPRKWYGVIHKEEFSASDLVRYRDALIEYDTLCRIRIYPTANRRNLDPRYMRKYGPAVDITKTAWEKFADTYAALELLGYRDLKEFIRDRLVYDEFGELADVTNLCVQLILEPTFDIFGAIHNVSHEQLAMKTPDGMALLVSQAPSPNLAEIGKFLMEKLAPYPTSYEACRAMCDKFSETDLYGVSTSLLQAVKSEEYSDILSNGKKLGDILDKLWEEADSIGSKTGFIRGGITIGIAVLGTVAAGPIGAVGGLLAALGYNIGEKMLELRTDSTSERIAKAVSPSYVVNVFDFKSRYGLVKK